MACEGEMRSEETVTGFTVVIVTWHEFAVSNFPLTYRSFCFHHSVGETLLHSEATFTCKVFPDPLPPGGSAANLEFPTRTTGIPLTPSLGSVVPNRAAPEPANHLEFSFPREPKGQ